MQLNNTGIGLCCTTTTGRGVQKEQCAGYWQWQVPSGTAEEVHCERRTDDHALQALQGGKFTFCHRNFGAVMPMGASAAITKPQIKCAKWPMSMEPITKEGSNQCLSQPRRLYI